MKLGILLRISYIEKKWYLYRNFWKTSDKKKFNFISTNFFPWFSFIPSLFSIQFGNIQKDHLVYFNWLTQRIVCLHQNNKQG